MKKKYFILVIALLVSACGTTPSGGDEGSGDIETGINEGQEALLYSKNRLLNANYDFNIDFYEENSETPAPKSLADLNNRSKNSYPTDLYDISSLPVIGFDAFKQIREYLELSSQGAKSIVNDFTNKITVLNQPVRFVPVNNGDEIVYEEPIEGLPPKIIDIPESMAMIGYDEETDTVTLYNHYKESSMYQISLSYDDIGHEVVNSLTATAEGAIFNTTYIPDTYCFYFSMELGYKNEESDHYDGYNIHLYEFKKINNYNWAGIELSTFFEKEKIDNATLTIDDLTDKWVTLYMTDFGHAYGVSLRIERDEHENLVFSPVKVSSGFMDYIFESRQLYFRISEMLGFDKMKVTVDEDDTYYASDCGEQYEVDLHGAIDSEDNYITTTNGKRLYSNSYIRVNLNTGTHIYEVHDPFDDNFFTADKMCFLAHATLVKGEFEDLHVYSPNAYVVSPYSYCYLYFFTDDLFQIATNINDFFTYFGLKAINGHPLYTGLDSILNIMNNPNDVSKGIFKYITGGELSLSNLLLNYQQVFENEYALRNETLHFFDEKEIINSTDLPSRVDAPLINLSTDIKYSVTSEGISFDNLNVEVNKSHLLFDDRNYALALVINNKIRKDIISNIVTYNGNKMTFSSNWSLPLPSLEGLYNYGYVLVKIENGQYIPISNVKDIAITDFDSFVIDSDVDPDGGHYEYHFQKSNGKLSIHSIYIEPNE